MGLRDELHPSLLLLLFRLGLLGPGLPALGRQEVTPVGDSGVAPGLPSLIRLALQSPLLSELLSLGPDPAFLTKLGFPGLLLGIRILNKQQGRSLRPHLLQEVVSLELLTVQAPAFVSADVTPCVGVRLVEVFALLLVEEDVVCLLDPVKGLRRLGVVGLVG